MRRLVFSGVMTMTLAVTCPALADGAAPAPAPPPAVAASAAPAVAASAAPALAPAAAPAPVAAVAPPKEAEPPLALRPSKALELAPAPAPTPWPYKIMFGAAVLAAAVLVWRKRRGATAMGASSTAVRVLGKTTTGLRGELTLVEVGGMRILVGITPSSMQTLAVLPDDFSDAAAAPESEPVRDSRVVPAQRGAGKRDLASRARSLFSSFDVGPPIPARVAASTFAASRYADERDTEGVPESGATPKGHDRASERRRRPSREVALEGQARGIALALGNRR